MNKEAIAKYALQQMLKPQQPTTKQTAPSHITTRSEAGTETSKQRKWWWSRKPEPTAILSKEEQKILKKVKSRAYFLDRGMSCCCIQIGFDGLIGLIPVVGDFIGLILAFQLVEIAMKAQLPQRIISQMMFNIGVDFMIGLVPLVGDILDIFYKCNTRNALLLEDYLIKRRQKELRHLDQAGIYPNHASIPASNSASIPLTPQHHIKPKPHN
ncbi:uncharacterized protein BYT42DRAFT_562823 [Radiomyces spectabilis]|uniref:uncharacterized protein n=1 Tax=Radiomyces spectabilis TaxID=64574 RepID=UPI00221F27F1|nr:uncharacterized protein BYT42DRAFT_562823 [Radiomyces spectabilis]KAI8384537.1 hypothetical protein BYT42DRAFT_562823 [Radiomyces spectabilis]